MNDPAFPVPASLVYQMRSSKDTEAQDRHTSRLLSSSSHRPVSDRQTDKLAETMGKKITDHDPSSTSISQKGKSHKLCGIYNPLSRLVQKKGLAASFYQVSLILLSLSPVLNSTIRLAENNNLDDTSLRSRPARIMFLRWRPFVLPLACIHLPGQTLIQTMLLSRQPAHSLIV